MAILFRGSSASFRTAGNAATTHNLFTIENATGSGRVVWLRRLIVQLDATAALAAVTPLVKVSRCAMPSGGTTLAKVAFDTSLSSHANIVCRGATASDGGGATAITVTLGDVVWQQYCMRMHTVVGQVLSIDNPILPTNCELTDWQFRLATNTGLLVQVVAAAGTSNPSTNSWIVNAVWEEDG